MNRATTERVQGMRGNAEHLLSEVSALGLSLDGHKYPFCQTETPAVVQMGSVIWSHLVYNVWPQKSPSLFDPFIFKSQRLSTPRLRVLTWKTALQMPSFSYLFLLNSLT